jgi:hypothetical protein
VAWLRSLQPGALAKPPFTKSGQLKLLLFLPSELKRSGEHDPVSERINRCRNERPNATVSPIIRLKRSQMQFRSHTQNSVERPQNRHLKPFKSRAELNGQIDPRINIGGRPKVLTESLAKELRKKVKVCVGKGQDGKEIVEEKLRAECVVEALVDNACTKMPHSVGAFRAIYDIIEPSNENERGSSDRELTRIVVMALLEKKS